MVHDEKVTVPLSMYTPPPCKQRAKCECDGNFARSLQHVPPVVDRSVPSCASVIRGKRVSNFPIDGNFRARTYAAAFPLMVHDEMATVPP